MASLTMLVGSMYAGKSSELIRLIRISKIGKKKTILFKPAMDSRYSVESVMTHSGDKEGSYLAQSLDQLLIAVNDLKPEVVGIDEVQFLDRSFRHSDIYHLLYDKKLDIICAGLDLDFKGNPFSITQYLMPYATKICKLKAVCMQCRRYTSCRTQRMHEGKPVTTGDTIQVGGIESYEARCLDCWVN